jgi:hypothetical protein
MAFVSWRARPGSAPESRALFASFPRATPTIIQAYGLTAMLILIGLAGLWRSKAWAVALLLVASVVTLTLDFLAQAPLAHPVATAIFCVLVLGLSRPFRRQGRL